MNNEQSTEMGNEQSTANYVWHRNEESCLGKGAFGCVFIGIDRRTGNKVAVKVCSKDGSYREHIEELKALSSPYITKYVAEEDVNHSFPREVAIIMELGDGTLASELKKESNRYGIPKQELLVLVDNCVKALEYLHFKKVSHRDIKPANVLVFRGKKEPTLTFKLCDFGVSRKLDSATEIMSTIVGTPEYSATNVIDPSKSEYGLPHEYTKDDSDIWSTACCFFEAATGRLPFIPHVQPNGENVLEEIVRMLRDRPPNIVSAQFDQEKGKYIYEEEMPQQHKSYTRSFRSILCRYFQLLFNKDKKYLKLGMLTSLSEEMLSIKEYEYYYLNTLTVESYCDTSSSVNFPRESFLDAVVKVVQKKLGDLDDIRISAASRKIREALNDGAIKARIPQANYEKPLLAVLMRFQVSQESHQPYCVATLRDTPEGVRLELQDNACAMAIKKADCTVRQLVEEEAVPSLAAYLLDNQDGNITDDHGETSFMSAASIGRNNTAKLPDNLAADANAADRNGDTPLIRAARDGDLDKVKTLLRSGANIMAKNKAGETALHEACYKGHVQIAAYLLDNGAEVNAKTAEDWTPLMSAARNGYVDTVQLLINRGANVNAADKCGYTAIIEAALCGHLDVVKTLAEKRANIMAKDYGGQTALHWACRMGYVQIAEYLLDNGADINAKNDFGRTPLMIAQERKRSDLVQLLLRRGAKA